MPVRPIRPGAWIALMSAWSVGAMQAPAQAAEGFQVRYNVVGSLGQDMFVQNVPSGWIGSLNYSYGRVHKVTGDGGPISTPVPGGTAPLPPPAPAALYPTFGPSTASIEGTGWVKQWNLALGYLSEAQWAGGRLAFGINVPYATRQQSYTAQAPTPALNWSPAVPPAARAAFTPLFNARYQAAIAAQGAAEGGENSGIGDVELSAGWVDARQGPQRTSATLTVVLPTGDYDPARGVDVGFGEFYTLRPSVQTIWALGDHWMVGGRAVLGLNTRNDANDLRSGNWAALEAAVGRHFGPLGAGVQVLHLRQVQDDRNNPFGTSRYETTNAGVFITGRVPVIEAAVTLQHTVSLHSNNAKHGRFSQVRLVRSF